MIWKRGIAKLADTATEALAETLWPTRCAICDMPGAVLCERCCAELPYVDWWRACKRCGSPFGLVQCDICNPIGLSRLGIDRLPFEACASAVHFCGDTGQIVRVFKDQGEQRLAVDMALIMARIIPPEWDYEAVTYVPATLSAFRYRGYDHAELIASALADRLGVRHIPTLNRPRTRDQRKLGSKERISNLAGSFAPRDAPETARSLILVDDVLTTGATLCAASQALRQSGVEQVRCLTFARV